jgi:hypothetical protein
VKKKDDTIAIVFVTIVTIVIWVWAAGQTKHVDSVSATLRFRPPEGSTTMIMPDSADITITLSGPLSAVDRAKMVCEEDALELILGVPDGEHTVQDLPAILSALEAIRNTGAEVTATSPASFSLDVQTMERVEAAVEVILPGVTTSGDVTVIPSTVMLQIPKTIRDELPEAITVTAVVTEAALAQLEPNLDLKEYASIRLPDSLDVSDVTIEPSRVLVEFKIRSKTQKWEIPFVRVLIAGPAEEYAAFSITLPRVIVPKVEIESDTDIIDGIKSGTVTVFAIVRLKSSELEDRITEKAVTTFLAFTEDGAGHVVKATVEDPALLNIELKIEKIEKKEEIAE